MISAPDLAAMQATANASMDTSIHVQAVTRTSDGAGGFTETWATVATVNGNLAQPTGQMMQNYDFLIGPLATWLVRVPVGTVISRDNQLVIGSLTLRVQVVLQPQSYQTSMRLLASEVQ
jgi:head-tail adaptor